MKAFFKILFLFLLAVPEISFSQTPNYVKSFNTDFSSLTGDISGFAGLPPDVVVNKSSTDGGLMNVKVNVPVSDLFWSVNCWSKCMIFDQTNRFIEFRVRCDTMHTSPIKVNAQETCWGCCTEKKTWPGISFTIPQAGKWYIVYREVPATTSGSQNVIDTFSYGLAWRLEKGYYNFDYVMMGIAAIPPVPTIEIIDTKMFIYDCPRVNYINFSGISIPDRPLEGLTIKVESLSDSVVKDVKIIDLGNGPFAVDSATNIATAAMQFTPVAGMGGNGDSIIVTLKDTIRGTTVRTAFYLKILSHPNNCINELSDVSPKVVAIYPNPTTGIVTLIGDNIINSEVFDITGRSQGLFYGKQIDLSTLPAGTYFLSIYGKEGLIKKEKLILSK